MKPEYNHGTHSYVDISLSHENFGKNPPRTKYILRQLEAGKIILKSQVFNWGFWSDVLRLQLRDEAEAQMILEKLEWAGAKPDVCYRKFHHAFPPNAFSKIVDWRRKPVYKDFSYLNHEASAGCHELTAMNEFSLLLWAEANEITEAYRLCMFPSFKPAQVIRIWFHQNTAYCIHKEFIPSFCPDKPKIINAENISVDKWYALKSYMQKFWSAKSWYSVPENYGVNDGTLYFFEGWRDGEYKVLDEHSPDDGISYDAIELFKSIAK